MTHDLFIPKRSPAPSGRRLARGQTQRLASPAAVRRRLRNPLRFPTSDARTPTPDSLLAPRASLLARRSGVSLLEVLFAIGIVAVGLLGVLLLIPLADYQMQQGSVLERANQVGANAFRQFEVAGMTNPENWIWNTRNTWERLILPRDLYAPLDPDRNPANGPPPEFRRAFCLDPRFVAVNGSTLGPNNEDPRRFPYVADSFSPAILTMPRLTLPSTASALNAMGLSQADLIFVSLDDLDFRRPTDDRTLPPVQVNNAGFDWDPNGPAPPAPRTIETERVRKALGRMSWMATIVPHERVGPNGDEYVLSVIVFHQRDASFSMDNFSGSESGNERVVRIPHNPPSYSGFISGGFGGGDVALAPRDLSPSLSRQQAERELEVRAGDWVMLSRRNFYVPPTGPPAREAPRTHRWYRVLAAEREIERAPPNANYAPPGTWVRFVTLDGPDWTPFQDNNATTVDDNQVTIVKNVVAVFEKTIRLETSSLWLQ